MPDPTVMNGRRQDGTFGPGNQAAAGRTSRAAELRKAFAQSVSHEDIKAIAFALVEAAKGGDIAAAKLVLDRCCGRPSPDDETAEQAQNANRVLDMLNLVKAERDRRVAKNAE